VKAKKGEIRDLIKKALEIHKSGLRFTQIRDFVEKELKRRCADRVIVYNLQNFKENGIVYRDDGGRWKLTDTYFSQRARDILHGIVNMDLPIALVYPPDGAPFFGIGHEKHEHDIITPELINSMQDAVVTRISYEVDKILCDEMEKKRNIVLEFAARCMWRGYLDYLECAEKSKRIQMAWKITGEKPARSLEELFEEKKKTKEGWEDLVEFLHIGLRLLIGPRLSDFELRTLSHALIFHLEGDPVIKSVPVGKEENIVWLKEHVGDFGAFLKEVTKIKFAYITAFGFSEMRELRMLDAIEEFEDWFKDLRRGNCDHRTWIFDQGKRALENVIYRMEHEKTKNRPITDENFLIDPFESWSLYELYRYHPRGRDVEFYRELLTEIEKRIPTVKKVFNRKK